ncbi:PD40 domain-containing protein [bacterium]|nr:PD40 domain-containing protein [bacterium]
MRLKINPGFLLITLLLCAGPFLSGQEMTFNHPELSWYSMETDHFFVHYHEGTERTAALLAKIGEEIYGPITTLYDYEPDTKIHIIVKDFDDYANGAAYYYDNKIEFWAPAALDFPFRGTSDWLRNTMTHEFSHMISLGSARKFSRQLQAFYFQWLGYEKEKRRDVIHGYPNILISFPFPGTITPMWFAEGMAQYQRAGLDYESWDTHRDMLLRTAVLDGSELDLDDMGYFGKNSLGNERVYNQGYGLTRYIASQYGEHSLRDLTVAMKKPLRVSFSDAVKSVTGKTDRALYEEWLAWLRQAYTANSETVRAHQAGGTLIEEKGIANFFAAWSPDGNRVAYVSNRGHDYQTLRSLWLYDVKTKETRKLKAGVGGSISWSPDGEKLVYAMRETGKHQCRYYDLYIYDIKTKKETQITHDSRARQPDWHPDGKSIVCVVEKDGISNLAVTDPAGRHFRQITDFHEGESIHLPRFMPDGRIVFAMAEPRFGRDIALIDSTGSNLTYAIRTEHDERDPVPDPDGRFLYYSSDRSGIFNIYRRDLETGEDMLVTDVLGGAFMPSVNTEGSCVFSRFDSDGFKLAMLDSLSGIPADDAAYESPCASLPLPADARTWSAGEFDDRQPPELKSVPYKSLFSKFIFLPRIFIDFPGKPKIGSYCYNGDFIDKFSFFGGAAVNSQFDTDLFGIFEYRRFTPTLSLELYQVRRKTTDETEYFRYDKIHFNMIGATLGMNWPMNDLNRLRTSLDYSRYRSSVSGFVKYQNVPFKMATTYHKGLVAGAEWQHYGIPPTLTSRIAPNAGRHFSIRLDYAMQDFFDFIEQDSETGLLIDKYRSYDYFQTGLDWHEFLPGMLRSHSTAVRLRLGWIDRKVDPFYHLYAGGLDGMKGYPFYSLEGRKLVHLGLAYRFPLMRNMNLKFAMFRLKDVYLSLYGDSGDAWVKEADSKEDVGVQLRMGLYTYYGFPMNLAFDAAYGLDKFTIRETEYGGEWRFYVTLLFNFMDLPPWPVQGAARRASGSGRMY